LRGFFVKYTSEAIKKQTGNILNENNYLTIQRYIKKQGRNRIMNTNASNKIILAIFGISGLAVLIICWLQPMAGAERVLATVIGVAGLSPLGFKVLSGAVRRGSAKKVRVSVRAEHRPY